MEGRQPGEAREPDAVALDADRHGVVVEVGRRARARGGAGSPMLAVRLGRIGERREMIAAQREADRRMRDREALDGLRDRLRLGAVALQEFQPRRRRGEEVGDLDRACPAAPGRAAPGPSAGLDEDRRAGLALRRAGDDREPRHGADRGQGLAPEAERRDGEKIAVRQLRGGVALDGELEILGVMPSPSSTTRISRRPPASIVISTVRGAGVDGVLDEFLHGRGRPLDDLARGDAVDEDGIEAADGGMACESGVRAQGRRVGARPRRRGPRGQSSAALAARDTASQGPCPPRPRAGRKDRRRAHSLQGSSRA